MRTLLPVILTAVLSTNAVSAAQLNNPTERGVVAFQPLGDQGTVPERYRLEPHSFPFTLRSKGSLPGLDISVSELTFPSPVTSACEANNTVYADYHRPAGSGPFPGVVILDITAGDQRVSKTIARHLAQNGVAGLCVQMAYYGPRRPAGSRLRLLSADFQHSMEAVRQTVLDIRRAAAWLTSRPEIDRERVGVVGTSLGSMVAALAAEMEPRFRRVVVLLGGGGLVDAYYDHPKAAVLRTVWEACGGTKEKVAAFIAPADPITCASNLKDRRVLIIAGKRDEIVAPKMAEALARAAGADRLVWFDCTHYGAAAYFLPAMTLIVRHLKEN